MLRARKEFPLPPLHLLCGNPASFGLQTSNALQQGRPGFTVTAWPDACLSCGWAEKREGGEERERREGESERGERKRKERERENFINTRNNYKPMLGPQGEGMFRVLRKPSCKAV